MKTHTFTVTLRQQLLLLLPFFSTGILYTWAYFVLFGASLYWPAMIAAIFLFAANFLPVIILHAQYAGINHKAVLVIDERNNELDYHDAKTQVKKHFSDIRSLEYFASFGHMAKERKALWYNFVTYRYYKLTFSGGEVIYITCLMINDIENTLEILLKTEAKRHFRLIPLIRVQQ